MTQAKNIRHILVIKPSSLGDILHVFPALQILRERFPDAELDFLVNPEFAPLLDFSPFPVTRKILFERKKMAAFPGAFREIFKLIHNLRQKKYDLVIDFQGLFRSAFFAGATRHTSGSVYGFSAPRERIARIFYSRKAGVKLPHAVEKNVELVNFVLNENFSVPSPQIPVDTASLLEKFPGLPRPFVLLLPGARWESKCFPAELFARTANNISQCRADIHFITAGSKAEIPTAKRLCAGLPENFPITDLTGKTTLGDLFSLISLADAVICNDSGPMHVAALLEKPVFAFFGPTDPDKTGPWRQRSRVFSIECSCSICMNKKCPLQQTLCHNIDPQTVAHAVLQQIYQEQQP